MARSKVKLAYITNDAARRVTYKKRKRGMMKKISELSTLCGVDACAIVYNSRQDAHPLDEPEVWPSRTGVERVIEKFRQMPEIDQNRKRMDHADYLTLRIAKEKEKLKKKRHDNNEKEFQLRMHDFMLRNRLPENLSFFDLNNLAYHTDMKLREIDMRLQMLLEKENKEMMMDFAPSSGPIHGPHHPLESGESSGKNMNHFSFMEENNHNNYNSGFDMILGNARIN
ncbi:agamous-like MADS-box protein AGL80 [Arachis stenosperma]|uniref:agamous-like MADS-box protein AGL80 n=1 Tax=Arachis stenosperma TaxID=217475 RepID=UPI0025ABDDAA|nr:agamous-like MADS-box protein AGL80 [Arachis stenosperma]